MTQRLTPVQKAELQQTLLSLRDRLQGQLDDQLAGGTRAEHARDVLLQDGDDAPQRDADREVDLARSDQNLQDLRAVQEALARLPTPDYGVCVDCGSGIPFGRLQHQPEVVRCVACQGVREGRRGAGHHATL